MYISWWIYVEFVFSFFGTILISLLLFQTSLNCRLLLLEYFQVPWLCVLNLVLLLWLLLARRVPLHLVRLKRSPPDGSRDAARTDHLIHVVLPAIYLIRGNLEGPGGGDTIYTFSSMLSFASRADYFRVKTVNNCGL
jgi:hypothetical protein